MKKSIKIIGDLITEQRTEVAGLKEKEVEALSASVPKAALLTCPYPLRFWRDWKNIFLVSSYGGALASNETTLDYAINTLAVPVLLIMGHEDCSALKGALKGEAKTKGENELYQALAPAFAQGKARKYRDNVMKHLDYQISLALDRYRLKVKEDKLVVAGLYCDLEGNISLVNYNGLRGADSLAQALPDLDAALFL